MQQSTTAGQIASTYVYQMYTRPILEYFSIVWALHTKLNQSTAGVLPVLEHQITAIPAILATAHEGNLN